MRIKNIELQDFILFLDEFDLVGTASRMRTRFKNSLIEYNARFNNERMDIVRRYSHKDEEGKIKTIETNGQQVADIFNMESFNREFQELCMEDVVIDETEERKQMLLTVREIVLNCEISFKGKDADRYDRFCEILESIYQGEDANV